MVIWRKIWRSLRTRFSQWWRKIWQFLRPKTDRDRHFSTRAPGAIPLSYSHYEFLFHQLLEGVATEGWQQTEINDFFRQWRDRTTELEWFRWLERFGERVLASPVPNLELARRMVQFSQIAEGNLAWRAGEIGSALLARSRVEQPRERQPENAAPITPPTEPDTPLEESLQPIKSSAKLPPPDTLSTPSTTKAPPLVTAPEIPDEKPAAIPSLKSLEGVLSLLNYRPQMTQALAKQMGIESSNPEQILQQLQVRAWIKSSLKHQQQGNWRQAMQAVEKAIALDENYGIAWGIKGDLFFRQNRFNQAILAYDRATALNPNDEQAWYNRGMTEFKLERFESALSNFERSLELDPNLFPAWKNKAIALFNVGRYAETLAACDRALQMQPEDSTLQACYQNARQKTTM
ncbi:tetratricopeptide repeat protein [Roseofilum casamattae]|uniref:Tetratricopeptide repeat protein n=1 Tax=Roseofilum casamattae BLCC-M143 TaxID=3022442 RepID=A0ABT7C2H1_9CYAN|nr:tetratricopeptide repeat protein [Roseofilum casamattae]MDJ1185653.1 tetratricopeptide repeat protein [Roseofilum casamattae BLCC-M143]